MDKKKIIRVDEKEFELEDGAIYPHPIELEEVPSIEEFQKVYNCWGTIFNELKGKINKS